MWLPAEKENSFSTLKPYIIIFFLIINLFLIINTKYFVLLCWYWQTRNNLPLFSPLELVLASGAGNMSSKPQDTICFPPSKQEGDPGPPSKSNNLKAQKYNLHKEQWRQKVPTSEVKII